MADTNSAATTYSHTGLALGDTRHCRVWVINSAGTGPASNEGTVYAAAWTESADTGPPVPLWVLPNHPETHRPSTRLSSVVAAEVGV